jgi:hypothetical protein
MKTEVVMTTYTGGAMAGFGFYFNRTTWELAAVPKDGGVLPGDHDARFFRIPVALFFLIAPVFGLFYVMFLPVIGFALVLQHVARLGARASGRLSASVLQAVAPAWLPGHAYFADRARKAKRADEHDQARRDESEPRR